MAYVYFGAQIPIVAMNGDWTAQNQWYSTMYTDNGKYSAQSPGAPLGRLPNATDIIELLQSPTTNLPSNWLGDVRGTSNVSPYPTITGGTWAGLINGYGLNISGGVFNCPVTVNYLTINGNATFNQTVKGTTIFTITSAFTNTIAIGSPSSVLDIGGGIITSDISTSVTGAYSISIRGNATFTNPAPWIFGKQTGIIKPARFSIFGNQTLNRDITVYGTSSYTYGLTVSGFTGTINGTIMLLPCAGSAYTNSSFLGVNTGTYSPPTTVTIPVKLSGNDTLLPMATYPKDYGFKGNANFVPTVRLSGLPPGTDILGVLI